MAFFGPAPDECVRGYAIGGTSSFDEMILLPRLYAIVDSSAHGSTRDLVAYAEELAAGGCALLQYRNKSGNARAMLEQASELRRLSRARVPAPHVRLIMNDRADLCLAAEFDGTRFYSAGDVAGFGFLDKFSLAAWVLPAGPPGR